jgi:hypothetical protein
MHCPRTNLRKWSNSSQLMPSRCCIFTVNVRITDNTIYKELWNELQPTDGHHLDSPLRKVSVSVVATSRSYSDLGSNFGWQLAYSGQCFSKFSSAPQKWSVLTHKLWPLPFMSTIWNIPVTLHSKLISTDVTMSWHRSPNEKQLILVLHAVPFPFNCSIQYHPLQHFNVLLPSLHVLLFHLLRPVFDSRHMRECFHLHSVQTGSGARPAFYPIGTRGESFPGNKATRTWSWSWGKKIGTIPLLPHTSCGGRRVKLSTHLDLVSRSRMVELYLHCPIRLHGIVLN